MGLSNWMWNHYRFLSAIAVASLLLTAAPVTRAQSSNDPTPNTPSLGDLARKQKQKQQDAKDKGAKPKKVVTDEDMPEHAPDSSTSEASTTDDSPHADEEATPANVVSRNGDQRKAAILQQKNAIADLKAKIEKAQASIHFVEANAYRNGVEYNKIQAQRQQEVERAQNQLTEMQKNLEKMQEDARRAGFASAVWDP
jgi:dynactin complex subunit